MEGSMNNDNAKSFRNRVSPSGVLGVAILMILVLIGCSKNQPATRDNQIRAFKYTFGFAPGDEVKDIVSNNESVWFPNLGGYMQLLRFTYVSNVFERIQTTSGMSIGHMSAGTVKNAPNWWRDPGSDTPIYSINTNGTVKLMWLDNEKRFVYYKEFNVD